MQWSSEAEEAIGKVPFFVRRKVRARVEKEARRNNKPTVSLADVKATQKRYLDSMASEIKGYQLDICFGPTGCPNGLFADPALVDNIEKILRSADFIGFLKSKGIADLKFHHEFRVSVAECPNACSQPQIKDIGIIAARTPRITDIACSACGACEAICRDNAVAVDDAMAHPLLDRNRCMACGQCIPVCPTGTLREGVTGYRIQIGGKLGRHPQLARELPGIYPPPAVIAVISACIGIYKSGSRRGERLGEVLTEDDFQRLADQFSQHAVDDPASADASGLQRHR